LDGFAESWNFALVTAADVQLMQGLAQRVTATRPDLVNSDATFGEPAQTGTPASARAGPKAAAQAHLDAWAPSTYTAEGYQGVRQTAAYRGDLHILAEAPDGTMASSTIMWLDEANKTAEFEPVGMHPDYRRLELGRAMLRHGMHRAGGRRSPPGSQAANRSRTPPVRWQVARLRGRLDSFVFRSSQPPRHAYDGPYRRSWFVVRVTEQMAQAANGGQ
jgi:hypothetical protein